MDFKVTLIFYFFFVFQLDIKFENKKYKMQLCISIQHIVSRKTGSPYTKLGDLKGFFFWLTNMHHMHA